MSNLQEPLQVKMVISHRFLLCSLPSCRLFDNWWATMYLQLEVACRLSDHFAFTLRLYKMKWFNGQLLKKIDSSYDFQCHDGLPGIATRIVISAAASQCHGFEKPYSSFSDVWFLQIWPAGVPGSRRPRTVHWQVSHRTQASCGTLL